MDRISGLMITTTGRCLPCSRSSRLVMSMTAICSDTPTWFAARPTPGAAYMVSIMSSISCLKAAVDGFHARGLRCAGPGREIF